MWYVFTPFLQGFTSVAFSKCFGAFIVTIVGFTLKILNESFKFSLETSFMQEVYFQ